MTTEQMTLWPDEDSATLREIVSAEAGPIRHFVPNDPSYVYLCMACRIDEVKIDNGHVSFNLIRRLMGMNEEINDVDPDQLNPFPSGVCCWGNNDIDMFLFKLFKDKTSEKIEL